MNSLQDLLFLFEHEAERFLDHVRCEEDVSGRLANAPPHGGAPFPKHPIASRPVDLSKRGQPVRPCVGKSFDQVRPGDCKCL